jgi:hypothetical protein
MARQGGMALGDLRAEMTRREAETVGVRWLDDSPMIPPGRYRLEVYSAADRAVPRFALIADERGLLVVTVEGDRVTITRRA